MLKADLHLHTSEDPQDKFITYNARQLIDYAKNLGFDVIAITNHGKVFYNRSIADYAKKKGILLIPGVELFVENSDLLVYNITQKEAGKIKKISDIEALKKRKNILVAAPHPYYIHRSLGKKLEKNIRLFDAIEYCHFYLKWMNVPNKKAARIAHRHKKPLMGNSDSHYLWRMNTTYSLIDSEKDINSVISAIKKGRLKVVSRHLSFFTYLKAFSGTIFGGLTKKIKRGNR